MLPPDEKHPGWHILGDPTEAALLTVAAEGGDRPSPERREQ